MIYTKRTPFLEVKADFIVCPVSKDGIIGYGLIKDIFYKYSNIYPKYIEMCKANKNTEMAYDSNNHQWICLFTIKNKASDIADIDCIAESLNDFIGYNFSPNATISFPELGYNEIDKIEIEQLMYQYLDGIPQKVYYTQNTIDRKIEAKNRKE